MNNTLVQHEQRNPSHFYLYMDFPEYLSQWFANEQYCLRNQLATCKDYVYDCKYAADQLEPVKLFRASVEHAVLRRLLVGYPRGKSIGRPSDESTICIRIPQYSGLDILNHNYLNQKDANRLKHIIQERCRAELYQDMLKSYNTDYRKREHRIQTRLEDWMEIHGIEINDRNYKALSLLYYRTRAMYKRRKIVQQ